MNGLQPAPTLILGGFLITPEAYGPMAPASHGDWLLTSWSLGWTRLLDRVQALLAGAEPLLLEGVGHGGWFAERWYSSVDVLPWWVPWLIGNPPQQP